MNDGSDRTGNRPPLRRTSSRADHHDLDELDGYVGLGMKEDALRLAKAYLTSRPVNPDQFTAALDAILVQADRLPPWRKQIESAYRSLPMRGQLKVKLVLLAFFVSLGDWQDAARFIPRQLIAPFDMLCAMWTFSLDIIP